MLKLVFCELMKLKRQPLFYISMLLSFAMPLAFEIFFPSSASENAMEAMMSVLYQLGAPLLLMPLIVVLSSNMLFVEQDHLTLKNLMTVPVGRGALVFSKMLLLLLFSVGFMACGGLLSFAFVCLVGRELTGFLSLFAVALGEGVLMWVGALPCVLLVVLMNRSYIVSVIVTFVYTAVNYILSTADALLMQPFGLNPGTLLPGPLLTRWMFQYLDHSNPSVELATLLDRISPYFMSNAQAFGVAAAEAVVLLALIAWVYGRQDV